MKSLFFVFACSALLLTACTKNNPDVNTSSAEMPFQTAEHNTSIVSRRVSYVQSSGPGELGYVISFNKNGTVTGLGAEMATLGTYKVSFWDNATHQLLVTASVQVTDTNHIFYANIPAVTVTANTKYVVSILIPKPGVQAHWLYLPANSNGIFPFTVGSVTADLLLDVIGLSSEDTPVFPAKTYGEQYLIGCDLIFQPS